MKRSAGFTLIELVMVIVILGILAATALPKYIDLKASAGAAAADGVAGALGAASAINKASRSVAATLGVAITSCQDVSSALDGGLTGTWTITATNVTNGATASCTVGDGTYTENFVGHGIT